jgi:hypothetical protein
VGTDQGVTGFKDTAGRNWNLATYVEMATRSATRRAFDDAKTTTMQNNGVDLVLIAVGRGSCKKCAKCAGKILRLDDGPTGRIKVQHSTQDREITVKVEATLDQAKAEGWRHPNCRCSTAAYLPGLSVVADVTTYDPQAEADRAKLRSLERDVRAAKAKEAGALDDESKRAAAAQVRIKQAQVRAHVADTGLMRQRNREQLDYGHARIPGSTRTRCRRLCQWHPIGSPPWLPQRRNRLRQPCPRGASSHRKHWHHGKPHSRRGPTGSDCNCTRSSLLSSSRGSTD